MAEEYLIWGAGGHGKVAADLIRRLGGAVLGYIDSDGRRVGSAVGRSGDTVLFDEDAFFEAVRSGSIGAETRVALGVGDNLARLAILRRLGDLVAPPLIHPSAVVADSAVLGIGTVVFALVVVNADASVGRGVILNTGAIVEHDCQIGDGAHVSPGAVLAGGSSVGELAWLGASSVCVRGVRIGAGATVGAGAVVLTEVPDGITVVGNPARPITKR